VCQAVLGIIYTLASSTAHSYLERKLKIKKKRKGGDGDHMQGLFKDNDEMTGLMSFLDNADDGQGKIRLCMYPYLRILAQHKPPV
jgi:hypothetical protein